MKILILVNDEIAAYLFRKELIEELVNRGYTVYISSSYGDMYGYMLDYFEEIGCKIVPTKVDKRGKNIKNDLKLFFYYIKIIKDIMPDAVLSFTVKPNLYGGIACRIRKVKYIPSVTGLGSGFINEGISKSIITTLSKISFKGAYKVMIQNESILEFLRNNNIINDNYKIVPGSGVNLSKYKKLEYPKEKDTIKFNFMGRVIKDKGIDEFLEVARRIRLKYSNVEFNVIGRIEEDKYKEIIEAYEKEGIICYYPFTLLMIEHIKNSSCTILASYSEGMSNVLLESAASGRPMIASNIPGCKEIVDHRINGYLFEVKNIDDLYDKVEEFINLDYSEKVLMGLKGREKVEKEFDRKMVVEMYIKEIEKLKI